MHTTRGILYPEIGNIISVRYGILDSLAWNWIVAIWYSAQKNRTLQRTEPIPHKKIMRVCTDQFKTLSPFALVSEIYIFGVNSPNRKSRCLVD